MLDNPLLFISQDSICNAMSEPSEINKNPSIAALLSAFIIGTGHIYIRKWKTGICCIAIEILLIYSIFYFQHPFPIWPLSILWYWQIWDAFDKAEEFNQEVSFTGYRPW